MSFRFDHQIRDPQKHRIEGNPRQFHLVNGRFHTLIVLAIWPSLFLLFHFLIPFQLVASALSKRAYTLSGSRTSSTKICFATSRPNHYLLSGYVNGKWTFKRSNLNHSERRAGVQVKTAEMSKQS